ncbi:hypothetical protein BGZ58_008980 [Dissophora ornata]|nr:hypothetical protein BGZ58_008980 [Dissophora ornata]
MTSESPLLAEDACSIVQHLPTEIVLAFGQYLDSCTLVTALQVCREWNGILQAYVWRAISKKQWHHLRFPLVHIQCLDTGDSRYLLPKLLFVRHIEWWSNRALTATPHMNRKAFSARKQTTLQSLTQLLSKTPSLESLSLSTFIYSPYPSLDPLVTAMMQLHQLKQLNIAVWSSPDESVALHKLFPVLSRLEELVLRGSWYKVDDRQITQDNEAWPRMRTLKIQRRAMMIVGNCINLTELDLGCNEDRHEYKSPVSLLPLLACPKLEKLKLDGYSRESCWVDVAQTLGTLGGLKSLDLTAWTEDHYEFLNASPDYRWQQHCHDGQARNGAGTEQGGLLLPLLEHLRVCLVATDNVGARECMHNVLQTRPRLKTFVVYGTHFYIGDLFARPGMGHEGGWACKDLEVLRFELSNGIYRRKEAEECRLWQTVYRQLGQLHRLKHLYIRAFHLRKGRESGIEALAPEGRLSELQNVVLSDGAGAGWSRSQIQDMVGMMPKLKYLHLKPLERREFLSIKGYLKEIGREDIDLETRRWSERCES